MNPKDKEALQNISEETAKTVSMPISLGESRSSFWGDCTGQTYVDPAEFFGFNETTVWLHARIKRDCYILYAKYRYHCWTSTDKAGKKKIKAAKLEMEMDSGNGGFSKSDKNVSQLKKLDEVYANSNVCSRAKMKATATIGSTKISTRVDLK